MPTYLPPTEIVRDLEAFDPQLRLRWSDGQGQWRLERKVSRGQVWPASEVETAAGYESRVAAKEGYILVDLIHPSLLNSRLVPILRQNDIWSNGGAKEIADAMDTLDADQQRLMKLAVSDQFEQMARDRWKYMNRVRTVSERHAHTAPRGGMSIND